MLCRLMKHFTNLENFERRIKERPDWHDYFMLGGRMYQIYEYGGGWGSGEICYAYFVNKRTHDMIHVTYRLNPYELRTVEFEPDNSLWRPIV